MQQRLTAQLRGALLLALSALAFGGMFLFAKVAMRRLPGPEVALLRFVVSLAAVLVLRVVGLIRFAVPRDQLLLLSLRGFFGGSAVLLLFIAAAHGSVSIATLLNYTSPVFTAIFAWLFLGESLTLWAALAFVVAGTGVYLVLVGNGTAQSLAIWGWPLLGMVSAVLAGAAVTAIRALRRNHQAGAWTVFTFFSGWGVLCTLPIAAPRFVAPLPGEWPPLLLMGCFSVLGQVLMTYALGFIQAALAGIINQLTVIVTMVLGSLFLDERVSTTGLLGTAVTIAGVIWAAWLSREEQ